MNSLHITIVSVAAMVLVLVMECQKTDETTQPESTVKYDESVHESGHTNKFEPRKKFRCTPHFGFKSPPDDLSMPQIRSIAHGWVAMILEMHIQFPNRTARHSGCVAAWQLFKYSPHTILCWKPEIEKISKSIAPDGWTVTGHGTVLCMNPSQ